MSFASKFNKTVKFDVNTEGFEYESLNDLYNNNGADTIYPLRAIYINTKSKFGDYPIFATDVCFVNAPEHMLENAKEILADKEAVQMIKDNKVGFKIYSYTSTKYNRECFGIEFIDVEPSKK